MKKRKDKLGQTLNEGESEYRNGYRYRRLLSTGKTFCVYASTLEELREKIKNSKKKIDLFLPISGNDITLKQQIHKYLKIKRGIKKSSKYNYELWFNVIKDDPIMSKKISLLKTSDIKYWISDMADAGKAQSTINGYFTALVRPALELAVEDGDIYRNPADFKLTKVANKDPQQRRCLTQKEQNILIHYLYGESEIKKKLFTSLKNPLMISLLTGMRISEVCGLTVDDIDFENMFIHVRKQLIREKGILRVDTLKTTSGKRDIPITTQQLKDVLEDSLEKRIEMDPVDGISGFLFSNRAHTPLDRTQIRIRYTHIVQAIDRIEGTNLRTTTPHCLRHTFCSNMIMNGVNIRVTQYLMGHKSANTTLEIYSHVTNEFVAEELDKIDAPKLHQL